MGGSVMTRAAVPLGELALLATVLLVPAVAGSAATSDPPLTEATGAPAAWVEPSLARVRRGADARDEPQISIAAARGEEESFQIAVHADGGALTGATIEVSDLDGPGPASIDADQVTLYR